MAKNKPLKDEEYDSIDEIQTTLDRHTDKLNRIEAGLVSIKSEIASVSKTGGHNMDSSGDRQFIQLINVILFIFSLLYINKIIITIPYKRNRIETKSII